MDVDDAGEVETNAAEADMDGGDLFERLDAMSKAAVMAPEDDLILRMGAVSKLRTARSKGVSNKGILFRHALKNVGVPIVTVVGSGVALLISGAVVTETVFSIPGVGRLTVDAILRRDYPIIQGVILMFSFMYVLVNLTVDLLYRVFDPRIKY
jgi:ABC-type microcin C transport system permease subunit YejB